MILNTADYCLTTTTQLEDRIRTRVDEALQEKLSFDPAREAFITSANAAIRGLVKVIDGESDLSFWEMVNMNWGDVENVGDQSGYVGEMRRGIQDGVREVMGSAGLRERYIQTLCDKVVEWFGGRFIEALINCRPICEAGAEQVRPIIVLVDRRCCWMCTC
jgi:hypothetical protein